MEDEQDVVHGLLYDGLSDTGISWEILDRAAAEMRRGRRDRCTCGVVHSSYMGPCETWKRGQNWRCVYCDHTKSCHSPSLEHKTDAVGALPTPGDG